MPWQRLVANVGLEVVDGARGLVPAYREVVITVPRQSGKTLLVLAWEIQRALGWERRGPQRIAYSAQTGTDGRRKLIDDQLPLLEPRKRTLGIRQFMRSNGSESILWNNGSRLVLIAKGDNAGHGKTLDLAVKDEFFADVDDRRDQALLPGMVTREAAQMLTLSTAGTSLSIPLNRKMREGRAAVERETSSGVAYFEWSADPVDDPDDEATWRGCMPALGHTQPIEAIRHARTSMADGEFRRAFLNQQTETDERLITAAAWGAVCNPAAEAQPLAFGVDVNAERTAAAIVVAGGGVVEVVEHRPGTRWLVDRAVELSMRHGVDVVVDRAGPIGAYVDELEARTNVRACVGRDFTGACGAFYDAVMGGTITVRSDVALDAAVAGVARREIRDAWAWARKSSAVDISPLVAATVAFWAARDAASPLFAY